MHISKLVVLALPLLFNTIAATNPQGDNAGSLYLNLATANPSLSAPQLLQEFKTVISDRRDEFPATFAEMQFLDAMYNSPYGSLMDNGPRCKKLF
jgi:hypothetical protein